MSKYHKQIKTIFVAASDVDQNIDVIVDVYDVLLAFEVTNPAVAHAIKKQLMPGLRGDKSVLKDLKEARDSITRAIEMVEEETLPSPNPDYPTCVACGCAFLDAMLTEGVCPECHERAKPVDDEEEDKTPTYGTCGACGMAFLHQVLVEGECPDCRH